MKTSGFKKLENRISRATCKMTQGFISYFNGEVKVSRSLVNNGSFYVKFNSGRPNMMFIESFTNELASKGMTPEQAEKTKISKFN